MNSLRNRLALMLFMLATFAPAFAQVGPFEQSYKASQTEIENALKDLHAYTGASLPLLDGFVIANGESLDDYQRPYYQFSFKLMKESATQTKLTVRARISAWNPGKPGFEAGYKSFDSSGRLETDLFDRLRTALVTKSASSRKASSSVRASNSSASNPFSEALRKPLEPASSATSPKDSTRTQHLAKEQLALEEILRNQSHPTDLVAVKVAHTPVFSKPEEGAQILFFADVQDEFQVLDTGAHFVHVKIAGISRGWIRSSQLEFAAPVDEPPTPTALSTEPFRSTKEELAAFPGDWSALRGKNVKVIWVKPLKDSSSRQERLSFAENLLHQQDPAKISSPIEGVVVVFDSAEGGMMAATTASLREWRAGTLSESAFLKQCWFDPIEAFVAPRSN